MKNTGILKRNGAPELLLMALTIALLFFGLGNNASAQAPRPRLVSERITTQAVKDDSKSNLNYEIKYRLLTMKGYTVFDWLEASADRSGAITLRGQATSAALKAKAEQLMSEIEGISGINNQIEVLPVSETDKNLRSQLYRAVYNQNTSLSRYATVTAPTIHIVVKNGNVVLRGNVDSLNDGEMAFVAANAVPRVLRVTNNLRVNNTLVASLNDRNYK